MEQDILSEVIETEKAIQRCLDEERAKARTWLEVVKKEAAQEQARAEQELQAEFERALSRADQAAAERAAAVEKDAAAVADRLRRIDDAVLQAIAERRVGHILPG